MILIFGGAYQGKLDYAKHLGPVSENEVFNCTETLEIDFSKKIINDLEQFILACVNENIEAKDFLEQHAEELADKIIIVADISQGIVPMDPAQRQWREMVGRTMLYLGKQAEQVHRVFCGLGHQIK